MESVRMRVTDFSKQTSTTMLRSRSQATLPLIIVCWAEPQSRGFNGRSFFSFWRPPSSHSLASFCSSLQTRPEDRDPKTFSWGQVYLCEPLCARRKNLQLKNLVSSIFQRLNLLPPQEGEGFLSRGAALPSSPGGMTAAVLETLERLPSIKVRCITGWAYESHANLVLTEGPKGRAATYLVLRITIRMSRKATMARGLAALTSGGTSATAALVRKTGAGWVESAGERLWWYNVVQYNVAQYVARGGAAYLRRGE